MPVRVHVDPQASLVALVGKFPGTELDVQGAGDHLDIVDRMIRRVKNTVRCVKVALPWDLPRSNTKDVVSYAVSRINSRRTTSNGSNVAPRVLFTGRKIRHDREFGLKFGDYCEVADPTVVGVSQKSRSVDAPRTQTCIALSPCCNEVGSWIFLHLTTNTRVRRSVWTKMVTNDVVTARMNQLASDQPEEDGLVGSVEVTASDAADEQHEPAADHLPTVTGQEHADSAEHEAEEHKVEGDVTPHDSDDSDSDVGDDRETLRPPASDNAPMTTTAAIDEPARPAQGRSTSGEPLRRSERLMGGHRAPERYEVYHISARKGVKEYGTDAYRAIAKELDQLIRVKKALAPVHRRELSPEDARRVIRSSLFLRPKHDAAGAFEKIKARLVANGAQQDKDLYPDRSSPTAALESIMCVLTVAAKQGRKTAGIDIGAAYLNALMIGDAVHIIIEKMIAAIAVKLNPTLREYLQDDGTLCMRLDKALYGTLIAGRLWFDTLIKALTSLGFEANPVDPCVMNKTVGGNQLTIVIFVDDILATCVDKVAITWLINELIKEFDEVKGGLSDDFSYLGMHVRHVPGKVLISMEGYECDVIDYRGAQLTRHRHALRSGHEQGAVRQGPCALLHHHREAAVPQPPSPAGHRPGGVVLDHPRDLCK